MIGNKEKINECKWSIGEETLLATCSDDHAVKVNYFSTHFLRYTFSSLVQGLVGKTPTSRTTSSQISSDNDRMESFAVDFSQVIYKKMKIICIQFENVSSYSASVDGTINIWNASEGALLYNLDKVHQRTIKTLAFSPDGEMLASGGYDNLINVWKFEVNMPWD